MRGHKKDFLSNTYPKYAREPRERAQHRHELTQNHQQERSQNPEHRDSHNIIPIDTSAFSDSDTDTNIGSIPPPPTGNSHVSADGENEDQGFVARLAQQPILKLDYATDGQAIDVLEFWGLDNPEDLLERFGKRRILLRHNGRIRKAQSGWLKPLGNPPGYFLRTLEAKRKDV